MLKMCKWILKNWRKWLQKTKDNMIDLWKMFKWSFACEEMEPYKIVQVLYFKKVKCAKIYKNEKRNGDKKQEFIVF